MRFKSLLAAVILFSTLMMLSINASQAQNGDKGTVTVHEYDSNQTYQGEIEERPGGDGIYIPSQQEFIPFGGRQANSQASASASYNIKKSLEAYADSRIEAEERDRKRRLAERRKAKIENCAEIDRICHDKNWQESCLQFNRECGNIPMYEIEREQAAIKDSQNAVCSGAVYACRDKERYVESLHDNPCQYVVRACKDPASLKFLALMKENDGKPPALGLKACDEGKGEAVYIFTKSDENKIVPKQSNRMKAIGFVDASGVIEGMSGKKTQYFMQDNWVWRLSPLKEPVAFMNYETGGFEKVQNMDVNGRLMSKHVPMTNLNEVLGWDSAYAVKNTQGSIIGFFRDNGLVFDAHYQLCGVVEIVEKSCKIREKAKKLLLQKEPSLKKTHIRSCLDYNIWPFLENAAVHVPPPSPFHQGILPFSNEGITEKKRSK